MAKRYSAEWHSQRKQAYEDQMRFNEKRKATPYVVMAHGFNAQCDSLDAARELVAKTCPDNAPVIFVQDRVVEELRQMVTAAAQMLSAGSEAVMSGGDLRFWAMGAESVANQLNEYLRSQ